MDLNIVLIPVDKTSFSQKILPAVQRFLPASENQIILIHVADPPRHGSGAKADLWQSNTTHDLVAETYPKAAIDQAQHPIYDTQIEESLEANLKADFAEIEAQLTDAGYNTSTIIRFGEPSEEIIDYVKREAVDMVAMTTHSHAGLSRLLLGSVAEQIVRNVSTPILLLRPENI